MYVLCGGCYEEGSTDSMAEGASVNEGLEIQLQSLLGRYTADELRVDSKSFCSDFCKVVEEHASRWRLPLPQLRILEKALCYFTQASTVFTPSCDHVLHTLSSLALSVFELLLFLDQKDFHQEPLKNFTANFQECQLALARHQNVYLLQVEQSVRGGGPWACPALQAILSSSSLPQSEVDGCISSELPVFFELRIRYLLSCERVTEAMALAKCCAWHPTAGQHLFFLQVYLTWLLKTSQHDSLHSEVAKLNGKDAVHIICSLECEEKDELLLALSRAFLSQQLSRGDMFYLCDLVFLWSELHHRLETPKTDLLKEIHQLMLSATNVSSIFPFIRAILQEVGEDGIQFCVELCANALESCLPCDVLTKSLIYKTIAGLLPNDLEVCRACALLVFFLERTVEAYKTVYLLYMHPDQEYHVEYSPIRNHIRFETLQVLKKDLYFDPELWNLIALRTNCLKLMSEKGGVGTALDEIMEDKWISNYCAKELSFRSGMVGRQKEHQRTLQGAAKKRHQGGREDSDAVSKKLRGVPGKTRLGVDHNAKKRGNQGSRTLKDTPSEPLRRSFWQLDRLRDNWGHGEHRRITRLSQKNPPKRRIRTPRWLLEDSGTLAENNVPSKSRKHKLKLQKRRLSSAEKKSVEVGQLKNNVKPSEDSDSMAKENCSRQAKRYSQDCDRPTSPPVILELSLPDNELMGSFSEDTFNRQRGFPQMLLYKHTVKPATPQPAKAVHGKEVVLRARDASMFVQQLHCYARRPKGKGTGLSVQSSVSTITRSSAQGSPVKVPHRRLGSGPQVSERVLQAKAAKAGPRKTPAAKEEQQESSASSQSLSEAARVHVVEPPVLHKFPPDASSEKVVENQTEAHLCECDSPAASRVTEAPVLERVQQAQGREHCEESAVEMKVTIASKSPATGKVSQPLALEKASKPELAEILVEGGSSSLPALDEEIPPISSDILDNAATESANSHAERRLESNGLHARDDAPLKISQSITEVVVSTKPTKRHVPSKSDSSPQKVTGTSLAPHSGSLNDISALALVTEMVTEFAHETQAHKMPPPEDKPQATSGRSAPEPSDAGEEDDFDPDVGEDGEAIETEESRLEYCCTFCKKVFKGSRVIAHAMFHYRKDECMFCGTRFRDDLLAMMHLSDHIEKLKRSKDTPLPKTLAKSKSGNSSSAVCRSRGRRRKSDIGLRSRSPPESTPTGSRKLRSESKPYVGPSLREKRQSTPGQTSDEAPAHRANGHFDKKKRSADVANSEAREQRSSSSSGGGGAAKSSRSRESQDQGDSASLPQVHPRSSFATKTKAETVRVPRDKAADAEPQEKLCCPVESCAWFTDASRNRVSLLYHALDEHPGEVAPLKLAFRVGSSKCSICMRVMWTFDHFLHHVEGHRESPRYPCLHQGCSARFKTGNEMRRHTRKHSPLQATCCVPGCSRLFICLWALNLHEKEHYASEAKSKACDKRDGPSRRRLLNHAKRRDRARRGLGRKDVHKSRERNPPPRVDVEAPSASDSQASNSSSHRDAPVKGAGPRQRLRDRLGKLQVKNKNRRAAARRRLIKRQVGATDGKPPARRGRPPKVKGVAHTGQEVAKAGQEVAKAHQEVPKTSREVAKTGQGVRATSRLEGTAKAKNIITKLREELRKMSQKALRRAVSSSGEEAREASAAKAEQLAERADGERPPKEEIGKATKIRETKEATKEEGGAGGGGGGGGEAAETNLVEAETEAASEEQPGGAPEGGELRGAAGAVAAAAPLLTLAGSLKERTSERSQRATGGPIKGRESRPATAKKPKSTTKTGGGAVKRGRPPKASKRAAEARSEVDGGAEAGPGDGVTSAEAAADGSGKAPEQKQRLKEGKEVQKDEQQQQQEEEEKEEKKKTTTTKPRVKNTDGAGRKRKDGGNVHQQGAFGEKKKYRRLAPPAKASSPKAQPTAKEQETSLSEAASPPPPPPPVLKGEERRSSVGGEETASSVGGAPLPVAVSSAPCPPQTKGGDLKSKICMETLAEYSKRPYLRPPPNVYLDEKYTAMPKRRKEAEPRAGPSSSSSSSSPPSSRQNPQRVPSAATPAAAAPPQRQRCTNCFTTFGSDEELQRHLQLQRCSNLFGFDSDEEGAGF